MFAGFPAIANYLWVADATDSDKMSKRMLEIWTLKKGRRKKFPINVMNQIELLSFL